MVMFATPLTTARGFGGTSSSAAQLWTEPPVRPVVPAVSGSPWIVRATDLEPTVVDTSTKRGDTRNARGAGAASCVLDRLGAGFIVKADGYIVTANHVVDVRPAPNSTVSASVLGGSDDL